MTHSSNVNNNRTMREEYLIQGMPTALINHESQVQSAMLASAAQENTALAATGAGKPCDHSIDANFAPEFKETENATTQTAQFNIPKLRRLLKQYG